MSIWSRSRCHRCSKLAPVGVGLVAVVALRVVMSLDGRFPRVVADETAYLGSGVTNGTVTAAAPGQDGMPAKATIQLPPRSILVFSQTDVPVALSNFILE